MRRIICAASIVGLSFASLAAPATASDSAKCGSGGGTGLGIIDVGGVVYIDDRDYINGNGIWVYVETNGQPGLQRGPSNPVGLVDPSFNDACDDHSGNPDLNVF